MSDTLLAFDFGGTKLTAALMARSALPVVDVTAGKQAWQARRRVFSPPAADAQYDSDTMTRLGRELLAGAAPAAVGVSFGGPVDFAAGLVRLSHHVPGWENTPLQQLLETEFEAPVRIDNDANVAALGEHRFGAGRGYDSLLYVTVSTGVGGGWILDGRPWRGHEGMAGEIGHTVVDPEGPLCLCGKRGCVERLASGPYMARAWVEAGQESGGTAETVTGKMVAQAAAEGDEAARRVLQRGAWALGVGLGNAANLLNPQRFVLGGGVTNSGDQWWTAVRGAARETALPQVHFEVVPAALGDDAPLWGAVALAEGCLP
jgi:glucokinase